MASYKSTIDLNWNGLTCTAPALKEDSSTIRILDNVSGYAKSSRVLSVMGPSGAGKTTMMNILAGRLHTLSRMAVEGEVLVNGEPVDAKLFRRAACYVEQEDLLPATETVRECLTFNAALRLPQGMPWREKQQRVQAVLEELSLEGCADTIIGDATIKGVSGGQKRRLSVGIHLVTSPRMMFLDEPTSGLDSEIAATIMQTLRGLARGGRTIVLTIHQPNSDITDLFDDFMLLAAGRVAYAGPWQNAVPAFAAVGFDCPQFKNPSDYFMRVVSSREASVVASLAAAQDARFTPSRRKGLMGALAQESTHPSGDAVAVTVPGMAMISNEAIAVTSASLLQQLYQLAARSTRMWIRHPIMLVGEAAQYILLALFAGSLYFGASRSVETGVTERASALFFVLVTVVFTPPFTTATVWQTERALVRSETEQGTYSLGAFYLSKFSTLLPVEVFFALIVSLITYLMMDFQSDAGKFFIYAVVLALALLISEAWGTLFSLVTKTAELAIVLMTLVFIVLLALTGFLLPDPPVYYKWIEKISFLWYANAAMFRNELEGLTLFNSDGTAVSGETLLQNNPLNNSLTIGENIAVLIGMLVALKFVGYLGLCLAKRQRWM